MSENGSVPAAKYRIVFVDTEMGRLVGGAQTYLLRLLPGLLDRGHYVEVVTEGTPEPAFAQQLRDAGVPVQSTLWPSPSVPQDAARRLASWVNENRFHILVVSVSAGAGWLALPMLQPSTAVLTIAHLDSETFYAPLRHYARFVTRAGAVSREIARRLRDDVGIPSDRVCELAYGVPVVTRTEAEARIEARHAASHLDIAYIGRLAHVQKRIGDLVTLVKICEDAPFRFHIVGDGPAREWMESQLSAETYAGRIRFAGWLDWSGVRARLQMCDVFVLTSEVEGLPIALLEAMGQALVPVVSAHPATAAIVQPETNGVLVPVGDIQAFKSALQRIHDSPSLRARLAMTARDTAAVFSEESMVTAYEACFSEALAVASNRPPRGLDPNFPLMASCKSRYPLWLRRLRVGATRLRLRLRTSLGGSHATTDREVW